jgi:hypothetical protein
MKNKTQNTACAIDHFNVLRTAKQKSITLVQKTFDLTDSSTSALSSTITFHKVSFFKVPLREPSAKKEDVKQLSRCRPEGYKIRTVIFALLLLPMFAFQSVRTGALAGVVISDDHRPMANVMIILGDGKRSASTDSNGFFVFDPLDEGEYTALVVGAGLTEQHYSVRIQKDRITVLEIEADYFPLNEY